MIRKTFAPVSWITGAGHAAQTADLTDVTGLLKKIEIKITSVTDNPTANVTLSDITDTDFVTTLETFTGIADGTLHIYLAGSKEYDADKDIDENIFIKNDLRISVDPSADPGGVAQTLTVTVSLYLLERD